MVPGPGHGHANKHVSKSDLTCALNTHANDNPTLFVAPSSRGSMFESLGMGVRNAEGALPLGRRLWVLDSPLCGSN